MSTSVGDLVATLRMDSSQFEAGTHSAASATTALAEGAGSASTATQLLQGALVAAGTAAASEFVSGFTDAISISNNFNQMIQQSTISFEGLGNSLSKAAEFTKQGVNMGINLGIDPAQVEKSQQLLQGLVGTYADTADNLTKLQGAAVTSGKSLSEVTDQVATISNIFSQSPQSGIFMAMQLVKQNIESMTAVHKAQAEAETGSPQTVIFQTMMEGLHGSTDAAKQYADTLTGATTSLKDMAQVAIGTVFKPVYEEEIKVAEGLKKWLDSAKGQDFLKEMSTSIAPFISALSGAINLATRLIEALNPVAVVDGFKDLLPVLAAITAYAGVKTFQNVLGTARNVVGTLGNMSNFYAQQTGAASKTEGAAAAVAADKEITDSETMMAQAVRNSTEAVAMFDEVLVQGLATKVTWAEEDVASARSALTAAAGTTQEAEAYQLLTRALIEADVASRALFQAQNALTASQGLASDAAEAETVAQTGLMTRMGGMGGMGMMGAGMGVLAGGGMMMMGQGQNGLMGWGSSIGGGAMMGAGIGSLVGPEGTVIGGLLGALGGAVLHEATAGSRGSKTNSAITALDKEAPTYASSGNAQYLDNLTALQKHAKDASDALDALKQKQDPSEGVSMAPGDMPRGGYQSPDIKAMTTQVNAANDAVTQFNKNMAEIQGIMPGASMQSIIAEAQQLGINLAQVNLASTAGTSSLNALMAGLKGVGAGFDAANTSATAFGFMMKNLSNEAMGKTGMSNFSFGPDLISKMSGENAYLAGQGYDTRQLQNDTSQLAKYQGQNFGTDQSLSIQLKQMEQTQKWLDLNHQLVDANHAVTQAKLDETNATFNLAAAQFNLIKATQDLANAQFSLHQSELKDVEAQATQADMTQIMSDALKGYTDKYATLNANLNQLLPSQQALGQEIVNEATALDTLNNKYTILNNQYTLASMALQGLTDQMQVYQNIANAPLQGQYGQQQGIQENLMAQDQLKMQINQAELQGANSQSLQIINLQNQLDVLTKIGDQLNLQYQMTIGNQQFNIQQQENSQYIVTYQQALQAATSVGQLNTAISQQKITVDGLKPSLDAANLALTAMNQIVVPEITALQQMEQANMSVVDADHAVVTAHQGVADANQSLLAANHALIDANAQVVNSLYSYKNAVYEVQTVYHNMAQQQVQDNLTMVQSLNAYITDYQTALGQLQLMSGAALLAIQQISYADSGVQTAYLSSLNNVSPSSINVAAPHASGGLISSPSLVPMGEGSWPELILPLGNMGQSMSLLSTYAPSLLGGGNGFVPASSPISPMVSGGGSGGRAVTIAPGAIQVSIEGVPGAGEVANEVQVAVENALTQILHDWE